VLPSSGLNSSCVRVRVFLNLSIIVYSYSHVGKFDKGSKQNGIYRKAGLSIKADSPQDTEEKMKYEQ